MKENKPNKIELTVMKGVKLTGVAVSPELLEYKEERNLMERKFATLVRGWVKEGMIEGIDNKYVKFSKPMWSDTEFAALRKKYKKLDIKTASLRHLKLLPDVKKQILGPLFGKDFLTNKDINKTPLDEILWHIMESYKSFYNRPHGNKKKKFPRRGIQKKTSKALNFKDNKVKVTPENKSIEIRTYNKKNPITLNYQGDYYGNLNLVGEGYHGGNLALNSIDKRADNEMVLLGKKVEDLYMPDHVVGMDVNMKVENWITFSEELVGGSFALPKPDSVSALEKKRDEMNLKLRPPKKKKATKKEPAPPDVYKLNSMQRSKMYDRVKRVKRRRNTTIKEVIRPIFEYFVAKHPKVGFAIDGVATGGKINSFGQEDVRDAFVSLCVENKVPFVIVPPNFSSQKCPAGCGNFTEMNRKTSNAYLCQCGYHNSNTDYVGAVNIKAHGEFLFKKFGITSPTLSLTYMQDVIINGSTKKQRRALKDIFLTALYKKYNFPKKKKSPQS